MAWADRLLTGSWRGVPFQIVDNARLSTGRAGDDHVFPGSDVHYAEDASREPTRCTVDALLIGPDHDDDARVLFEALAQPGLGELVHPWFGRLTGIARRGEIAQSRAEGGLTRVSIDFIESGDPSYPAPDTISLDVVDVSAAALESAAMAAFGEAWSVVGETSYVLGEATRKLNGWATRVAVRSGVVAHLVRDIATLPAQAPAVIADLVLAVFTEFADLASLRAHYSTAPTAAEPDAGSDEEQTARDNDLAFDRLTERLSLARAATVCAETDWAIYEDADNARTELGDRLAAEAYADQEFAGVAGTLRAVLIADLDERMTDLARRRDLDLTETTDAVSLAWRLYGDPTRADEIAAMNDAEHPGYLSGPLVVLSE